MCLRLYKNVAQFFSGSKVQLLMIVAIQGLLLFIYSNKVITGKGTYAFYDVADGFKNNYTLSAYVEDKTAGDFTAFRGFDYPYTEVITYTDNTPLFAVFLKLINKAGFDTHGYSAYLFDLFSLFLIVMASVLCWAILKRVTNNPLLIILFSLTLPLLNPQILRFTPGGTLNLSYSVILLAGIYLLQSIYYKVIEGKGVLRQLLVLAAVIYLSAFVHLYYHLILLLLCGLFLLALSVYMYTQKKPVAKLTTQWMAALVLAFASMFITLSLLDENMPYRSQTAWGYGIESWKLWVSALFTAYPFLKNKFLVGYRHYIPYEAHIYMGSFALFTLTLLAVVRLFAAKAGFNVSDNFKQHTRGFFFVLLGIAALPMVFIAFGPDYTFGDGHYSFLNLFSLFYYAGKITDRVSHFRCLGRFSWPAFWALNLGLVYLVSRLLVNTKVWFYVVIGVIGGLMLADYFNTYQFISERQTLNPLTTFGNYPELRSLTNKVSADKYQCILPLPYYHTGTESYDYNCDPESSHFVKSTAFAYQTRLPLMASVMSRTPLYQPASIMTLIRNNKPDSLLLSKLSDKPILVYIDTRFYKDSTTYSGFSQPIEKELFFKSRTLVQDYRMTRVDSTNGVLLYELSMANLKEGKAIPVH